MTLALLDPDALAPMLGCTTQTVEDRLRDGTLPGVKLGRSWMRWWLHKWRLHD